MANVMKNYKKSLLSITKYYKILLNKQKENYELENINKYLVNNYRVIQENNKYIKAVKTNNKVINHIYKILKSVVSKKNYNITEEYLIAALNKFQNDTKKVFTYQELDYVIPTLRLIYIERLNGLCKIEYLKIIDEANIKNIIKNNSAVNLESFINEDFDIKSNRHYIFELNKLLSEIDNKNSLFKDLTEYLKGHNVILKDIISEETQNNIDNNILISNVFSNIISFSTYSVEKIYKEVSKAEEIFLKDSIYTNMTLESKKLYRKKLLELSNRKHLNEYEYIKNIYNKNQHIGFALFKKKSSSINFIMYLFLNILVSVITTFILSSYFINNKVTGFILLFIPVTTFIRRVINFIFTILIKDTQLPKLNLTNGIPNTMIVIPKILINKNTIKESFDLLVSYYKELNSDNIYFSLLGDPVECGEQVYKLDNELISYGEDYAKNLNKKYNKDIFFFLYRKKIKNEKTKMYSGFDQKRGAIQQFNKILIKDEFLSKKFFNINMLENKNLNIKYVISLDYNIKFNRNDLFNLIGTMIHPLNKPVLNKKATRVIHGYVMLQPKIVPCNYIDDLSQKIFDESNSVGCNIYDLKIYNKLLNDKTNLSLIRIGYVSDIEFVKLNKTNLLEEISLKEEILKENISDSKYLLPIINNKNKEKIINPTNLLNRYKIFNSIASSFTNLFLLIILIISFTKKDNLSYLYPGIILCTIIISKILLTKAVNLKEIYKEIVLFPYYAIQNILILLDIIIPYKHLPKLKINNQLLKYIIKLISNFIIAIIFLGIGIYYKNNFAKVLSLLFVTAPFIIYILDKSQKVKIRKTGKFQEDSNINLSLDENINNPIFESSEIASVLSNKNYSIFINNKGNSYSKYRTEQLNEYEEEKDNSGIFMIIKDDENNIWSNTYAPINKDYDKYKSIHREDKVEFIRIGKDIDTHTEITVCNSINIEIRKVTLTNKSSKDKRLELTCYTYPFLSNTKDTNTYIKTEFDKKTNSLIAKRNKDNDSKISSFMLLNLFIENPLDKYTYETEKTNISEYGEGVYNEKILNKKYTNYSGDNINPILTIRNRVLVKASSSTTAYIIVAFSRNKAQLKELISNYNQKYNLDKEFKISQLMISQDYNNLNINKNDIRNYNTILNYMYYKKMYISDHKNELLKRNVLNQLELYKFGLKGNIPLITVSISDILDLGFISDLLKVFEIFKSKLIFVNLVIINDEENTLKKDIKNAIGDELYRVNELNNFYNTPGTVTVIDSSTLTKEEKLLLEATSTINFKIENNITLNDAVLLLKEEMFIKEPTKSLPEENIKTELTKKLKFDNKYGGFINDGKEYHIYNKNTKAPWANVITNKNFGTIVSNNTPSKTYAYNFKEYKLTLSEGFRFNDKLFIPEKCTHGFGYSILESETKNLFHEVIEYVSLDDTVKIYLMKIKNKTRKKIYTKIEFFINPLLGKEEYEKKYISSEYNSNDNYLTMNNSLSENNNDIYTFISSSEKIDGVSINKINEKSVWINIDLSKNEEKNIIFILGTGLSELENKNLVEKYTNLETAKFELDKIKEYWEEKLGIIKIATPDESFNYIMNGWYLYQTISSNIFKGNSSNIKYRDKLQNAINVVSVNPDYTRNTIIESAYHQFETGKVLHWWNENKHVGLLGRQQDGHILLVYAVAKYIEITNDYSILEEQAPYVEGDELSDYEVEREIIFNYTGKKYKILNHCLNALELAMTSIGVHGLPLIGTGDYEDDMNKVGIKHKGESVWLGIFLYETISKFMKISSNIKIKIDRNKYQKFNNKLKDDLNKYAWDGDHYIRAFYDNQDLLGSYENSECKIELSTQCLSIISGITEKKNIRKIINSVEKNLVDKENKLVKLLDPPFNKSLNNPGNIMNYPKGIEKNGGCYTLPVSWYIISLIKTENIEEAYEYFQMINPISRTKTKKETNIYEVEPYVISESISSSENYQGKGYNTWENTSSSWFYKVGLEDILGINLHGKKLELSPKIPSKWKGFKVTYKYINTIYNIEIKKGQKEELKVDNQLEKGNIIKLVNDKNTHKVSYTLKIEE